MSQLPEDRDTRPEHDAPGRQTVAGASGPSPGEQLLPPNRPDPTSGKTAAPLSAALLWTVGILLVVAVVLILWFAL